MEKKILELENFFRNFAEMFTIIAPYRY